jgi:hypothetical protein
MNLCKTSQIYEPRRRSYTQTALTTRISDAKIKIQAARRAKIEEKLRPLESKNQELETKMNMLSEEDASICTTIQDLEDRENKLIEQIKTVKENGDVEERRLRNTVSLYVNSCSIGWDREDSNSVFCTVGGATSVKKVRLDRDATEFEVANRLWDLMDE